MNKSDLLRIGRDVLRPSDSGDVVEWLEDNVHAIPDSPMPGPFRSDRTPWIAEARQHPIGQVAVRPPVHLPHHRERPRADDALAGHRP
jgi:hypothetical protein